MYVNISVSIDKTERAKAFAFGFLEVIIVAKHDIVQIVSAKAGVDIVDTEKVIDSFLEYIVTEIAAGRSVVLAGFGAFRYRETAPRRGINRKKCKNEQAVHCKKRSYPVYQICGSGKKPQQYTKIRHLKNKPSINIIYDATVRNRGEKTGINIITTK